MRTATTKKDIIKSTPKKTVSKKAIAKKSKPKPTEIKLTAPLTSPAPAFPESSKTKQSQLIALLKDPRGATIQDLMQITGWQAHSVRGVISGIVRKRLGLNVIGRKIDGVHHYRIDPA